MDLFITSCFENSMEWIEEIRTRTSHDLFIYLHFPYTHTHAHRHTNSFPLLFSSTHPFSCIPSYPFLPFPLASPDLPLTPRARITTQVRDTIRYRFCTHTLGFPHAYRRRVGVHIDISQPHSTCIYIFGGLDG